jgi:hypothetical protein
MRASPTARIVVPRAAYWAPRLERWQRVIETRRLQTLSPDTVAGIFDLGPQGGTEATKADGDPLAVAEAHVANAVRDEFAHRQLGAKGRVRREVRYGASDGGACLARRLRGGGVSCTSICSASSFAISSRLAADAFFAVPAHLGTRVLLGPGTAAEDQLDEPCTGRCSLT